MNDPALKTVPLPPREESQTEGPKRRVLSWFSATITFIAGCATASVLHWYLETLNQEDPWPVMEVEKKIDEVLSEVGSLRHSVNYDVEEEIIFLKILYLHEGSPSIRIKLARKIALAIHKNCSKFKRDPDFVLAIMAAESNFNPKAVSKAGALGLMQVMPQWHDILRLEGDLMDIDTNIHQGLMIYGFYENMYKDATLALTAYNRGPGMVDNDLMRGKDPSRNGYAHSVLKEYKRLKRLSSES